MLPNSIGSAFQQISPFTIWSPIIQSNKKILAIKVLGQKPWVEQVTNYQNKKKQLSKINK